MNNEVESSEVKRKCDSCKEPVSINASKCPHCGSTQLTSRFAIVAAAITGFAGLPFTYVLFPIALDMGIPSGFEAIAVGIAWAIILIGPLMLIVAIGAYQQRKEAIKQATT